MKKKILNIIIMLILVIGLTGCGNNNNNETNNKKSNEDIAKEAAFLDWKTVHDEISANGAKATDYNDKWYIFSGIVSNIEENTCHMFLERSKDGYPVNAITVYLPTEELKELKDGQTLSVVGKFNSSNSFTDLKDAFVFPKSLYDDKDFVVDLLSYEDKGYTPHYFTDYKYDSNGNKINYSEISYSYTISGNSQINSQDTAKYTLTYNEKNQMTKQFIQKYSNKGSGDMTAGNQEATYTYNEDGFISTKTVPSNYVGEDYTVYTYNYEKDKNGKINKGTVTASGKAGNWGSTSYEYNENGDITKKVTDTVTVIYTYDGRRLINEKSTFNSSGTDYENKTYYYGVVGKR